MALTKDCWSFSKEDSMLTRLPGPVYFVGTVGLFPGFNPPHSPETIMDIYRQTLALFGPALGNQS